MTLSEKMGTFELALGLALIYYAKDAPSTLPKVVHYTTAAYLLLGAQYNFTGRVLILPKS